MIPALKFLSEKFQYLIHLVLVSFDCLFLIQVASSFAIVMTSDFLPPKHFSTLIEVTNIGSYLVFILIGSHLFSFSMWILGSFYGLFMAD